MRVNGPRFAWFLWCAFGSASADYEPCATSREVEVRCVIDGDTFSVGRCGEEGERIRLLGINAPEIEHDGQPAECYGEDARTALDQMIGNETVWLSFGSECQDQYGRTLAWVWIAQDDDEPMLVSEWMLRNGHARLYDGEGATSLVYRERLISAEFSAVEGGLGLWSECG